MRKLGVMGCSVLLLVSSALATGSNTDEAAIRKLDAEWSAAAQSKDVDKSVSVYAEDGIVLPANAPKAAGKAQIRAVWASMLALPGVSLSFVPTSIEVARSKDMAYDVGTYELK